MKQPKRIVVVVLVVAALLLMIAVAGDGDVAGMPNTPLVVKDEGAAAPRDGRGVTAPTATLLAAGLAVFGTLFGAGLGLFGDRYLRHRGDIRCKPSEWSLTTTPRVPNHLGHQNPRPVPKVRQVHGRKRVLEQAKHAGYHVRVKLFNETEVDTGLRDIEVVFTDDSGAEQQSYKPRMVDSKNWSMDPDAVNLPARQWVAMVLTGKVEPKGFDALARSTTAKLRACLPKDRLYERPIKDRLWG